MNNSDFQTILVLGGAGHLGSKVLRQLSEANHFKVVAFQRAGSKSKIPLEGITTVEGDLDNHESLVKAFKGVDAIISCLSHSGIESQLKFIPAAKEAGVRRFYPAEYGCKIVYTSEKYPKGYLHNEWRMKERVQEALKSSGLEWTIVEGGNFYDQEWEPQLYPWTYVDVEEFNIKVYGTGNTKITWTSMDDMAKFLVATLNSPLSKNSHLNYASDQKTFLEVVELLKHHSGKKVNCEFIEEKQLKELIDDPEKDESHAKEVSNFPSDFLNIVAWGQAVGKFYRDEKDLANDKFPEVKPTTFADYLSRRFKKNETS